MGIKKFDKKIVPWGITLLLWAFIPVFGTAQSGGNILQNEVQSVLREQVLQQARWALLQQPVTVTAETCIRSAGGKHDFYSEGDYWWPNPASADSPYVQRDGQTNPGNFVAHRHAMIRFSKIIGALASAYSLQHDQQYIQQAVRHCNAWFADTATKMNPHLLYAQAIKGRFTGRGIGIIDAIQLMEVAQGIRVFERLGADKKLFAPAKAWFAELLTWLTTHQYGKDEMNAKNNHGTCWVMQVAVFASLTGNDVLLNFCRNRYKTVLLPMQMETDGSFPLELRRTKPYGYSIFNLDAMATICQVLSSGKDNLWEYQTPDGKSIKKGISFLYPFIKDKSSWPFAKDVMYWDEWPVAQPSILFAANAYSNQDWFITWRSLNHYLENKEVIRNLPIRNPLLWLNN